MATKAEIVAELKKYSEYNDIKETVLMRELKATLEERLAKVKGSTTQEVDTTVVKPIKKTTRKSTSKKAKVDFGDDELDMDLLNDETIVNDFYGDDFEEVDDDFPF
jgi:hypothetical protein